MDDLLSPAGDFMEEIELDPLYIDIEYSLEKIDSGNDPLEGITTAGSINWGEIKSNCIELQNKKFNLRVEVWLLRASMHTNGCSALYESLVKIDRFLSDLSLSDAEKEALGSGYAYDDALAAILSWLSTVQCLSQYKSSMLSPEVPVTLELLSSADHGDEQQALHFSQIVSAISQANGWYQSIQLPVLAEQLLQTLNLLKSICQRANANSSGYQLDCSQLSHWIKDFSNYISSLNKNNEGEENESTDEFEKSETVAIGKVIKNRQDLALALDMILEYFEKFEPSHPAPILIRRSQKMIGMDFAAIVEDMLPDALATLQQFTGK